MSHDLLDWIKRIPGSHLPLGEAPLLGFPPPFPWTELNRELSQIFGREVVLDQGDALVRERAAFFEGLGDDVSIFNISVTGYEGHLSFIMIKEDVGHIMDRLIAEEQSAISRDTDPEFLQAFSHFVAFQINQSLTKIGYDFPFHIMHTSELENEDALCVDVGISIQGIRSVGRLVVWPSFQRALRERFKTGSMNPKIEGDVHVPVHLEIGKVQMTPEEWESVNEGDFIVLDEGGDKVVKMTVGGVPYVRGRLRNGKIKVVEEA